jgi:hypothetical protein
MPSETYLPLGFAQVGLEICSWSRHKVIRSVAGDKDIRGRRVASGPLRGVPAKAPEGSRLRRPRAQGATTATEANRLWKLAFGETT